MVSISAIFFTALFHLCMRVSIFFEQPKNQCSPAPEIASWLFVVSIFMLLLDNEVFPIKYQCISSFFQTMAETFLSLIITEFSMLVLWCNLEKAAFTFMKYSLSECKSNLYMDMGGDRLVGFLVTLSSICVFCNVSIVTGFYDGFQNRYKAFKHSIKKNIVNIWRGCPTTCDYDSTSTESSSICSQDDLRRSCTSKTRC